MVARSKKVLVDLDPLLDATKVIAAAIVLSLDSADQLTLPQLRALSIIQRHEPLNLSALAEGLGVNPSNASRASDQLVERGLVHRTDDPEDRRNVLLKLSPAGRRLTDAVMTRRRTFLSGIVSRMSRSEQEALHLAMLAFTTAADELGDEGASLSDGDGHLLRWLG
jgi:DNA-binding MarR family transcriptional regulator